MSQDSQDGQGHEPLWDNLDAILDNQQRTAGGAGIGLSITQRIIAAHGGSISAANRPDGGAIFTGSLPLSCKTH